MRGGLDTRKKIIILFLIISLLVGVDQGSRALIRGSFAPGESLAILGSFLKITFTPNQTGFSWFVPPMPAWVHWVYNGLLLLILLHAFPVYVYYRETRRRSLFADAAMVGLTAALTGHLMEYLFVSYTTDFIQIGDSPCANGADLYAYAGLLALGMERIVTVRKKRPLPDQPVKKGWPPCEVWRFSLRYFSGKPDAQGSFRA